MRAALKSRRTPEPRRRRVANDPLQAAFAVAFPSGATEKNDSGDTLTYTAKKLVLVVSDGSVQALISEGSQGDNAGHIELGSLRITYLNSTGDTFSRPDPRTQETLQGNGFGQPPDWAIVQLHQKPAVRVKYTYSNQGCTDTTIDVYVLDAGGIDQDKHASKPMKETCEDQSDVGSDSNVETPASDNASADAGGESNATSTASNPGAG